TGDQLLQGRSLHGGAGDATVIIHCRQARPTLVLLAADEGFASLALGIQGVEVLLETLLGGLARIDRAADLRLAVHNLALRRLTHRPSPSPRRQSAFPHSR